MNPLTRRAAVGMLFAHWMYLVGATLTLLLDLCCASKDATLPQNVIRDAQALAQQVNGDESSVDPELGGAVAMTPKRHSRRSQSLKRACTVSAWLWDFQPS